jgi:hypothetical protein
MMPTSRAHGASFPTPSCVHADDEMAARAERDEVERRRSWLLKLPQLYAAKHRQRFVFLHLDNTLGSLVMSPLLFRQLRGASCPHDLRLSFEALTDLLCGSSSAAVVAHQMAVYSKTKPYLSRALERLGWTLKSIDNDDKGLHAALLTQLQRGAATANGKTLVLALGGGGLGSANSSAYQEILAKFLVEGWHVEIYAWLRALNDGYLRLQRENPGRVVVKPLDDVIQNIVFVNKKTKQAPCAVREAPLESATSSTASDTASIESSSSTSRSSGSPRLVCVHSVPPATSPKASWIKAAMQGQQSGRQASPVSDRSSAATPSPPRSPLEDFAGAAPFFPTRSRAVSAPPGLPAPAMGPAAPAFVPPLPPPSPPAVAPMALAPPLLPMPSSPVYRWMLWELQMQQMQELLSTQQADLALRQCALQQTTELMRRLRDQQQKPWQPPSGPWPPSGL